MFRNLLLSATIIASGFAPAYSDEAESLVDALKNGDVNLNLRPRFELVDQDGKMDAAVAFTLRTRLNYTTKSYEGFSAFIEFEDVRNLANENYNNTINGKAMYPVIADPSSTELNQGYLTYTGIDKLTLRAGRQAINLNNQRMVGSVGWRQNDQTLDSFLAVYSPVKDLTAIYSYVWNVNRIFSDNHPFGNLDTDTHVINFAYSGLGDVGKVSAYGIIIDLNDAPVFGLSSSTIGLNFTGSQEVSDGVKVKYELEYASQKGIKDNPVHYKADYYHIAASVATKGFTLGGGYEVLGGNGAQSFKTPLATLHKYNGFADKFLATPGNGLKDLYIKAGYKFSDGVMKGLSTTIVYHDFKSEETGVKYGSEIDWVLAKPISKTLKVLFKGAHYSADTHGTDTSKVWLQLAAAF